MDINELTEKIIGICIKIHKELGPGLYESIYEEALCYEISKSGLNFTRQKPVNVYYDNIKLGIGFNADVIIEEMVIVELKSVENLAAVNFKQTLTYLRLTNLKLGLLINFNVKILTEGIHRIVNKL